MQPTTLHGSDLPVPEGFSDQNVPGVLQDFFRPRGFRLVERVGVPPEISERLNRVARFIGTRYHHLEFFLQHLKKHYSANHKEACVPLEQQPEQVIGASCGLCEELNRYFGIRYHYLRRDKLLILRTPPTFCRQFLCGGWLERFLMQQLLQEFSQSALAQALQWVINGFLLLGQGRMVEMDILFAIHRRLYRVEAKTGSWQESLEQYRRKQFLLSLEELPTTLVVPRVSPDEARRCYATHGIQVVTIADFSRKFVVPLVRQWSPAPPPARKPR